MSAACRAITPHEKRPTNSSAVTLSPGSASPRRAGTQPLDGGRVDLAALALVVGALIPVEAQPAQIVHDETRRLGTLRPWVQVLDAQNHAPAHRARTQPRHEARRHVSQVHAARGRGGKPANHAPHAQTRPRAGRCLQGIHAHQYRTTGAQQKTAPDESGAGRTLSSCGPDGATSAGRSARGRCEPGTRGRGRRGPWDRRRRASCW